MKRLAQTLLLSLALGISVSNAQAVSPAACDRACLTGFADRYVEAMLKQAPASLPWVKTVRFSEDGVPAMVGDALWGSIRAAKSPVMYAADPSTGQVAWFGIVEEHGDPAYLALRLRVEVQENSEAETVLSRTAPFGDAHPFKLEPAVGQTVAPRKPRAGLIAAVNGYLDNSLRADGKVAVAVAADCVRMDNGKTGDPALGRGCAAQLKLGAFSATNKYPRPGLPDRGRGAGRGGGDRRDGLLRPGGQLQDLGRGQPPDRNHLSGEPGLHADVQGRSRRYPADRDRVHSGPLPDAFALDAVTRGERRFPIEGSRR